MKQSNLCQVIELRPTGLNKQELTIDFIAKQNDSGMTPSVSVEKVKRSLYDKFIPQRIYDLAARATRPKGIMSDKAWAALAA